MLATLIRSIVVFGSLFGLMMLQSCMHASQMTDNPIWRPYLLDGGLESRSISFENPTGAKGEGGKAASHLGVGRKGSAGHGIKQGEIIQLCDITGPGTIRHFWMTIDLRKDPKVLRSLVIRAYWDDQTHPSIECPLGDLMGFAHGKVAAYQSAAHSISSEGGMNIWLPMPFLRNARLTLTNEGTQPVFFFYQIDYTLGGNFPTDPGRLHVLFRRENPTTLKNDFTLLPTRTGKGRYLGSLIGIRNTDESCWWGEGEVKIYLDGDTVFPTICGTGSEDYIGQAWGVGEAPFLYHGCSMVKGPYYSIYRWHLPDPIYWRQNIRVTMQQIGWSTAKGIHERQDDWSCATFWYEPIPSAPLPAMPVVGVRTADLPDMRVSGPGIADGGGGQ